MAAELEQISETMGQEFKRGDIIEGTNRESDAALHPIIFWEKNQEDFFVGIFLTKRKKGNVPLETKHRQFSEEPGCHSYFPDRLLIKPEEWGPYVKVGELTECGLEYVKENVSDKEPMYWEEVKTEIT